MPKLLLVAITGWYYNPSKNHMWGRVNVDNNWSPDSSGLYSFALGYNNKAKGIYSIAMGNNANATCTGSAAMSFSSNANGYRRLILP
jgi:hypothetical protein